MRKKWEFFVKDYTQEFNFLYDWNRAREKNASEGNFRELLKFRVNSGDKVLENHLKTVSLRATYISKTVRYELIDCCGQEIVLDVLHSVHDGHFYSIMFDEITDISHMSHELLP